LAVASREANSSQAEAASFESDDDGQVEKRKICVNHQQKLQEADKTRRARERKEEEADSCCLLLLAI
jgi:hypothetical protein